MELPDIMFPQRAVLKILCGHGALLLVLFSAKKTLEKIKSSRSCTEPTITLHNTASFIECRDKHPSMKTNYDPTFQKKKSQLLRQNEIQVSVIVSTLKQSNI